SMKPRATRISPSLASSPARPWARIASASWSMLIIFRWTASRPSSGAGFGSVMHLYRPPEGRDERLPAPQVDRPDVDHLVPRHDVDPFVIGERRIDVGRRHAHEIARRHGLLGRERHVLVGAEPYLRAGDLGVAVVHAERLQPAVGDRVLLGDRD